MAHEILEHDVQQGREMAWHGLTQVREDLSLDNCWLGTWDYMPIRCIGENGEKTPFFMLGVSDVPEERNEAGEVIQPRLIVGTPYDSDSFKPVTNARLIELLKKVTAGKDVILASNGTVKNRGRHYFSFQMGESYRAAGRDFVPYFNVGNGNDRTSPVWQNISNTCTVCNNTFQMNMLQSGLIMEVKKTKFSEIAMGDFTKAAKALLAGQKEFAEQLEALAKIPCNEEQARQFFAGFLGKPDTALSTRAENNIDRLIVLFKSEQQGNTGSNWSDVFQALTDFYTHEAASAENDPKAKWKNFVSSEFGSGLKHKQQAWMVINTEKLRNGMLIVGKKILKLTAQAAKVEAEAEAAKA